MVTTSAAIDRAVSERAMLAHAFYRAWEEGALPAEVLRSYARQYFHHVEAFPRAVSATHANCPHASARRLLAENLAEEEGLAGGKDDHATLWLHFAEALGADEAEVRAAAIKPQTQALIDAFQNLSRQSYAAGLGALYAYESQLPEIAATKVAGLARYGITDARAIRFFEVHREADVAHSAACRELLDRLDGAEREEAIAAAKRLSEALLGFLDGMSGELN